MRTILGVTLAFILASRALPAPVVVIPNGGAGVGSLSVINPATGGVESNLLTAIAPAGGSITNAGFAITNSGSAAVLGLEQGPGAVYILSVVNLTTGKVTGQRELPFASTKGPVLIAANPLITPNPKLSFLYLGYLDSSATFHIQEIDPITLDVLLDSNLASNGGLSMIVSPDGGTIYLTGYSAVAAVRTSNLTLIGTVPVSNSSNAAVSPDSSTLYVAAGEYPNMALTVIDTATLGVTQTVSLSEVSVIFGMAISSDGSQIYISGQANFQGTDIFTLDLATQALNAVSAVVIGGIAVSPDGTAYVGNGSEVLVFDPTSQSVIRKLTAYSSGTFALNSTGSRLYYLNGQSSTLAATGPPPSQTIIGVAPTGFLDSVAYDATNNRLLAADTANNLEVLDAVTFQPAGHLFLPNLNTTTPYVNASGGFGFITMAGEVLRFDPVSLMVTGRVALPNSPNYLVSFAQTVMNGSTLYVPFSFSFNGGPIQLGGNASAASAAVPANGIAVIDTLQMQLVAMWPFPALPLLGLMPGASVGYAALPIGDYQVELSEIDLSTGKTIAHVQLPGSASYFSNPAVSPDGSTVYFSTSDTLYTLNGQTLAITNTIAGIDLTNLTVSPDGNYLYGGTPLLCTDCSEQIISTSSLKVVGTVPVSTQFPQPALFLGQLRP
jgi:hypothetical protein